jgi:methylamine---glutamate N-methyltransferase subunit A
MCGIVGYLGKSGAPCAVGRSLLAMLGALSLRGPDSAGVAVWGSAAAGLKVQVKTEAGLGGFETDGGDARELARQIEAREPGAEVVSMGRRLEIVKQVGHPDDLEAAFGVSGFVGTHGLGHTRLSTESRIDLSHSQPFWAHGTPDLAVVHNGHITNYHRLRRVYEQDGTRFYTENDSEIIGIYLGNKIAEGASLEEAMEASVKELDGSFSYLAATADAFGFAKDSFCLKPLLIGEDAVAIAIANEEVALHAALLGPYLAREAGAGAVAVWKVGADSEWTAAPGPGPR